MPFGSAGHSALDDFDRGDRRAADATDGRDAGAGRRPVQMTCAGTAESHPTAALGAGHAEHVTKHPQQRGITVDVGSALTLILKVMLISWMSIR